MGAQAKNKLRLRLMTVLERLRALWAGIPIKWRKEAVSFSHTFVATFCVFVASQISTGVTPTGNALVALAAAAARAALKAAFNAAIEPSKKTDGASPSE